MKQLSSWLLIACSSATLTAHAARITVSDAATGAPLEDAVVEVHLASDSPRAPQEARIVQRDATFHPQVVAVPVGSQVYFPNQDSTRHHVYSYSPAKVFDLKLYLSETPPPVRFDQPGVVVLGCNIHDHMEAFLIISEADRLATTDAQGQARLATLPPGEHHLRVWHPRLEDTHQQWWETTLTADDDRRVSLELEASPPAAREPSSLQQRFNAATRKD